MFLQDRWKLGIDNVVEDDGERHEVWGVLWVFIWLGFVKSKVLEYFWEVTIGACSSALGKSGEGVEKHGFVHRYRWGCGSGSGVPVGGLIGGWGNIELGADFLVVGIHGSYRHGRDKSGIASVVVIFISSKLGLET